MKSFSRFVLTLLIVFFSSGRGKCGEPMKNNRNGQVLIEFALIMPVMFGILALIVDLGFGQWRHMVAQNIAQGAATAAAVNALQNDLQCDYGVACGAVTCPSATSNLAVGCAYAALGASSVYQTATTLTAGTGAPSGVNDPSAAYWVTAVVSENIAPLFGSGLSINSVATAEVWTSGGNKGVYLVR